MNTYNNLMLFLLATGVLNTLFLAIYLYSQKSRNPLSNKLLSLLLFFFTVKISYASLEPHIWQYKWFFIFFIKLAVTAYLCMVPLFIYYIKSIVDKTYKPSKKEWVLMLPALLFVLNPFNDFFWQHKGFYALQFFFLSFSALSIYHLIDLWKKHKATNLHLNQRIFNWLLLLQAGLLLVWATAFGKALYEIAAFYTLAIYFLIKVVMGDFKTISMGWQHKNYEATPKTDLIIRLKTLMETEKIYLDSTLTLQKLAKQLSVSLHHLSREINNYYHQNFTEYINAYRIDEAANHLASDLYDNLTIESIAYDCGFNSLSSFNAAFKKRLNCTPSQYRVNKRKSMSVSYN